MPPISVAIITRNEARNIARAIRSCAVADEVVVVDAESTDQTRDIAANLGARVTVQPWSGFTQQKNLAVRQAKHDWILSLDADEELDEVAQASLRSWKQSSPAAAGYRFARRAMYLGRWILHSGWYPDFKLRLFDRRHARWVGDYVHERLIVDGPTQTMAGEILHYPFASVEEHRARIEFYTDLAARELYDRGRRSATLARWLEPVWVFFHTYVIRLGLLDGYPGLVIARMAANYVRRKHQKLSLLVASSSHARS